MTVEECYACMGSDYRDAIRRLGKDERIKRFLIMALEDERMSSLSKALEEKDPEKAFRAAHTLKGICMNLSLTVLYESAAALADELRAGGITDKALVLAEQAKKDYEQVTDCIERLKHDGPAEGI